MRRHFAERGLRGAGVDGGYFQPFGRGCRNVLALLEGSDPQWKQEIIVVGAHYDHVGYGNRRNSYGPFGYIHNGADDNASGVSGVLETADALLSLATAPKRSILFALWDGEEQGLWGSNHFVSNPTVPWENVVLAVNVDMIGRLRDQRLMLYGTRSGFGLRRLVAECNGESPLSLDFDWEMKANSDHYPFFARRVPVLMFHTGLHDDMHRPSDDTRLINADGMQLAARLVFSTVYELANRTDRQAYRAASRRESPSDRRELERPLPPAEPRLGIDWQVSPGEPGIVVEDVESDSTAQRSGLRPGDRLLEFAGEPIRGGEPFRRTLLTAKSPVRMTVQRAGDPEPIELVVELAGKPSRVGISWREDDAEPGTVILTRVIPGSPADVAELQPGDRVYAVAGLPFDGSASFFDLVTTLPSPFELTVERNGRMRVVKLDVPEPNRVGVPPLGGIRGSSKSVEIQHLRLLCMPASDDLTPERLDFEVAGGLYFSEPISTTSLGVFAPVA